MTSMGGPPKSKQEHLRQLIAGKQKWSNPLSLEAKEQGFLGWHERGHLPHCDRPGLTQFLTFRLADSLPAEKRQEWEHLLAIEESREKQRKLEEYLDRGAGRCLLRDAQIAGLVEKAILFHNGQRFQLLAWVVMPNHVHVLLRVQDFPLSRIVQNWKSITAVQVNQMLHRQGSFWQPEYWERFMRNLEQVHKAVHYIEHNPVKARLCESPLDWSHSSARYRNPITGALVPPC